jgi:hypothetical protein
MLTSVHGTAHCGLVELSWVRGNCVVTAALAPVTGPFTGAGGRSRQQTDEAFMDAWSNHPPKHTGQALDTRL